MAARKKPPTRKQLAARKKFVKMVRARARALKAAKRAMGKRNPRFTAKQDRQAKAIAKSYVKRGASAKRAKSIGYATVSVRKNGKKLYGAAAAVLAKRGKKNPLSPAQKKYKAARKYHSKAVARGLVKYAKAGASKPASMPRKNRGTLLTNRKRNGVFRTAARKAISRRLHAPIRLRRRRNGAPAEIEAQVQKFLGHPTSEDRMLELSAPAGTPRDVALLGSLVCLKTSDEDFEFDKGEAYLGADGRGNLYVLGDTTPVETNTNFGHIEEIRYEARKDHLNPFHWRRRKARRNSANIEYYHYFGEEDGRMPSLKSDGDGLLHIAGGNYKIQAEGIIN